jgi:hypothetical protein
MPIRLALSVVLLTLAACAATDPYMREGVWRPNNANEANLRAMVAVPSHLVAGVAGPGDVQQAAAALERHRNDKMRLLPDSGIAKIVPVAGSGSQQGSQ